MLGKLLKYDFRALSRVMLPLQICVFVGGIIGCFLVNLAVRGFANSAISSSFSSSSGMATLETMFEGTSILIGMLVMGLVLSSAVVTLFLLAHNLYRSFLTDEGYLTFTLPVSTGKHLLSKIICGFIWLLINAIVLIVVLIIFSLVAFSTDGIIAPAVVRVYGQILSAMLNVWGIVFIIEAVLLGLTGLLSGLLQIYASLIIGAAIARTHKVLAAIGIYFALTMVIQTLMSVLSIGLMMIEPTTYLRDFRGIFLAVQPFMIVSLVVTIALSVALWFVSYRILKSKLNFD